jgi:copper chaperone CopZ
MTAISVAEKKALIKMREKRISKLRISGALEESGCATAVNKVRILLPSSTVVSLL